MLEVKLKLRGPRLVEGSIDLQSLCCRELVDLFKQIFELVHSADAICLAADALASRSPNGAFHWVSGICVGFGQKKFRFRRDYGLPAILGVELDNPL